VAAVTQDSDFAPIPGLDGAERQAVGHGLWQAWRSEGRPAAVLTGISGVGKSEGIVRPLMTWAARDGVPTVGIEVPTESPNLDATLVSRLVDELTGSDNAALAAEMPDGTNFFVAARALLRAGALVVIDEFQRLLDPEGRPLPYMALILDRLARRPADGGCLWLVSSRRVDWAWTEKFYVAQLEPPQDTDAIKIVLANLATRDADARFPPARRSEIVRRLGHNPRVLRLLGLLLRSYALEELLGPIDARLEPFDSRLVDDIERTLLAKAAEGLSEQARTFLSRLSILRDWASWGLVEAMCDKKEEVREHLDAFRERFLIQALSSSRQSDSQRIARYQVHPLVREADEVRLRRDPGAWQSAHRRAGEWFARPLRAVGRTPVGDAKLTAAINGVMYHLTAITANDELADAIRPVRGYIERRYGWNASMPATAGERDARIALLDVFHSRWGTPGTHYHAAVLLRLRGAPGDLVRALSHAEKSTEGQDSENPWTEWVRLERAVNGLNAGLAAARKATVHIAPGKNLVAAYQLLGGYLSHLGRVRDALAAFREGTERAEASQYRLCEAAAWIAAAERSDEPLAELSIWLEEGSFEPQLYLARVLSLQRQNRWREAALLAQQGRRLEPTYLHLALHESLSWLGTGDAAEAQKALDSYVRPLRPVPRSGSIWLVAFVALQLGDVSRASRVAGTYLDTATPPTTSQEIRAALLHEWDHQVAIMGESVPSLIFPVLPPALTGLPAVAVRLQYGDPVLPHHQTEDGDLVPDGQLHVLSLATEWSSAHGGLSTFNRQLCSALATSDVRVTCVVLGTTPEELKDAASKNVTLVAAPRTPGASNIDRLSRRPAVLMNDEPDIIIGHGRITGPAAHRLGDDFPRAKRLHFIHMIPDDIERHKLDRGVDVGALAEERQAIELDLSTDATAAVAVGPRMYNWFLRDLEARGVDKDRVLRFDPGFDAAGSAAPRTPPDGAPWMVLAFGRAEDDRLKGLDLAARAFAVTRQRRRDDAPAVELLVRGAPPHTSAALEEQMRGWADDRSLPVRVRPYSTQAERLAADLRAASLVLMPSRAEGFGLVGVEAIVAKVPVLVSSASGLGELIRELLPAHEAARVVVATSGDDTRDVDEWSRAIEAVLRDREAAFSWADELQSRLAGERTWVRAVSSLLAKLDALQADRR
jgi:glycosyltransferase involved in cell wall biosynthesis/tetratricopeptide (TPR) repeat protein